MTGTRTLRDVELARVGTWNASTGPVNLDLNDLHAIVAAAADPDLDAIPVSPGHVDPRFDGEPALGWAVPTRVEGGRLLGDITGVPDALADLVQSAWPRRSIEAVRDVTTAGGRSHRLAMTGLALLGVTAPAIKGLASVTARYVAASSGVVGRGAVLTFSVEPAPTDGAWQAWMQETFPELGQRARLIAAAGPDPGSHRSDLQTFHTAGIGWTRT